ncbi:MAG: hypothetical protein ACLQVD_17870 [Capsulimonadaceae bacterium]
MNQEHGEPVEPAPLPRAELSWVGSSLLLFLQDAGTWVAAVIIFATVSAVMVVAFGILITNRQEAMQAHLHMLSQIHLHRPGLQSRYWVLVGSFLGGMVPLFVILGLWGVFQLTCLVGLGVKKVRGEPITLVDAFTGVESYLNVLMTSLLITLVEILPLSAFAYVGFTAVLLGNIGMAVFMGVLAGLFMVFIGALFLPAYALAVQGVPALQALELSVEGMRPSLISGIDILLIFALLLIASALTCFSGLLIVYPMLYLLIAIASRVIIERPEPVAEVDPGPQGPQVFEEWPDEREKRKAAPVYRPVYYGRGIAAKAPQTDSQGGPKPAQDDAKPPEAQ